jgi:KaiC/GvpD/RAD55 family RecA-like ATPase
MNILSKQSRKTKVIGTWIRLNRTERDGQYVRSIHVHKSRGAATSDEVVEFQMTKKGLLLGDPLGAA